MESAISVMAAFACIATLIRSYGSLKAPFFLYLLAAGFSLACATAVSCRAIWPPAEALTDMGLAAFGIILTAASHQLLTSFRQAGESHD
jgi:hypothetical protein